MSARPSTPRRADIFCRRRAADAGERARLHRQFGAEANRLGWTPPQLFGVQSKHGFLRVEYDGALMVNDSKVVGVEPDRIVFDRFSRYWTKPGQT